MFINLYIAALSRDYNPRLEKKNRNSQRMHARNASHVNTSRQCAETIGAPMGDAARQPIPPVKDICQ